MGSGDLHIKYREEDGQKAVASYLDGLELVGILAWNHPPNEGKRPIQTLMKLLRCGLKPGEPDCQIFPRKADVWPFLIELKLTDGVISKKQKDRQTLYSRLGYRVFTVFFDTPNEAVRKVERILRGEGLKV